MDDRAARRRLETQMEAFLSSGMAQHEADELFRLVAELCPDRLDFREVCEHLYDGIHITDGEGKVLFINEAYTRTTGIRPEDVLGRRVSDIEAEGKLYRGSVTAQVLERRERVNSVATILGLNKEVLVTGTPVFGFDGAIKMVVTNTRDFPELKRLEQQLLTLTEESRKAHEELAYLRRQQAGDKQLSYRSAAMQSVMSLIQTVAPTDVTVLITGESGTGKELVANELYQQSDRRGKPFIKVNCAAIPSELLESELFGYEEGAFTGAKKGGRLGLLEISHQGTLFLDEVEGMSPALQVKLLRVLQEREIMRVGGTSIIPIDVRIVAATNESLERKVAEGTFRRDLYYRLSTLPIVIPPLSERGDDLFLILEQFQKELGGSFRLTPQVRGFLKSYSWPGNIRELRNVVEYFLYTGHDPITMEDLPPTVFHRAPQAPIRQLPETPQQPSSDVFRFVLEQLYQASEARQPIGRERLLQLARDAFVPTSQQEIRSILAQMADQGLVRVSRGRGGSQLTPEGRQLYETGRI